MPWRRDILQKSHPIKAPQCTCSCLPTMSWDALCPAPGCSTQLWVCRQEDERVTVM